MYDSSPPSPSPRGVIYFLVIACLILLLSVALFYKYKEQLFPKLSLRQLPASTEKVIARVGKEDIFQRDFDFLTGRLPANLSREALSQTLLEQLTRESVILQGAEEDGLIQLNNQVFNTPQKNFEMRRNLLDKALIALRSKIDGTEGIVVAVWFNNPESTGSGNISYAERKAIAYAKISRLNQKVKSGEITIRQAAEQIQNDAGLIKLDKLYKINASFTFSGNEDRQITSYPEFDSLLSALAEGETSSIYTSPDGGYLFGQVTRVVTNTGFRDFEEWLRIKKTKFKVTYH